MAKQDKNFRQDFQTLLSRVVTTIEKYTLLKSNEHILVAVSGGPDSVALLHLLYKLKDRYNLQLGVVHYEHGIRGEASLKDATFVESLAQKLNLPFYIEHGNAKAYAKEKKLSLEAAARLLRYDFFERVLKDTRADKLALGHTADDQVEEILRRLLRGTAWAELAGMEIKRDQYIRPLLEIYKEDILVALVTEKIPYVVDVTNLDMRFLRNRIRHKLIPFLLEFNLRFKENLLEMSSIWREENAWMETAVKNALEECGEKTGEKYRVDLTLFGHYHPALQRRILTKILKDLSLPYTRRHLENLIQLAFPGGTHKSITLPKGWKGYKEGTYLYITPSLPAEIDYHYLIKGPGIVEIKELNFLFDINVVTKAGLENITLSPSKVYIDLEKAPFPLEIRPYRPGDRFYPLGGKGSKKLKDFFIDVKIPFSERKKYPVFLSQGRVIWIAGLRLDARVMPGPETTKYLVIDKVN
ncbi:MAG: tRNA lysidine(34) synthetase TilS [Candidatus Desulfofervidaceae bacterium]|nr:tRNA lysidine(34) synthetase TilS [Candidatus Desulfofervidaceae bacterium]